MAPSLVLRDGRPRLVVGSAGSLRLRGAILQVIVNVVGHGLGVREAIDRPRVHLDDSARRRRGRERPGELDRLEALGYELVALAERATSSSAARRGRAARGRDARRRRRPAARGARRRGRVSFEIRRGRAGRRGRARRARAGGQRGAGGLAARRRRMAQHVGDERRYLRAARRSSHAAVFVAEAPEGAGRAALGRARPLTRRAATWPTSGLMVAASHRRQGIGRALLERTVEWARASGISKLELHVFAHNTPAIALYESFGFEQRGLPPAALPPGRRIPRRDPDGLREVPE